MTTVFVGPTLPAAEVRAILPSAQVRGPVAVGDMAKLACARKPPARVVLIDGYFERMAAVWHKEILFALERGIQVWGCASMGAIRAAELGAFGMIGQGSVYADFATGKLEADDEVAVAHLPAAQGYRAVSDALVNLRYGIALATGLSQPTRRKLVALAQARFYRERTWAQLAADARAAKLPEPEVAALLRWVARRKPDLKAADARTMLTYVAKRPLDLARVVPPVPRTWAFQRLLDELGLVLP
ncbi:MAG TPA: TfuA-like protein [Kofleriaceae bacterium]|jgi:hypothetical protein